MENLCSIKVLIADNNKLTKSMLKSYLEAYNFTVFEVHYELNLILSVLRKEKPDILVMDYFYPDGESVRILETVNLFYLFGKPPGIIIYSSLRDDSVIEKTLEMGVDYYIVKPMYFDIIRKRIKNVYDLCQEQYLRDNRLSQEKPIDENVSDILHHVGIPSHLKGYYYLKDSILFVYEGMGLHGFITKEIYPFVAQKHHATPTGVERAIRHAIQSAYRKEKAHTSFSSIIQELPQNFTKPTNREFIMVTVDYLRKSCLF